MKTRPVLVMTAVLVVVLASGAFAGSRNRGATWAQDEPAQQDPIQEQPALPESAEVLVPGTRPWSSVGAACAPDDDTPHTQFESFPSFGYVEHAINVTTDLNFVCNVTTPIDASPGEPTWNYLFLTFKDTDANGFVQATLYKKRLTDGAVGLLATLTSTNGVGIRQVSVNIPVVFDFDTNAYFVKVLLYRNVGTSDQEFHIVRLQQGVINP